jgi:hypothetical protein
MERGEIDFYLALQVRTTDVRLSLGATFALVVEDMAG